MSPRRVLARAHARVGLLGNPSDIYSGYGLGFAVDQLYAEVLLEECAQIQGLDSLLEAAWSLFRAAHVKSPESRPFKLSIATNIPFQAGLAGSSAILIAALRAWADWFDVSISRSKIAELAWKTEVEILKIRAGPLDRLVQAYEGLVAMDFSGNSFEQGKTTRVDPALLPPLLIAWHSKGGTNSGDVHAPIYARFLEGDTQIRTVMAELAENAQRGRDALVSKDLGAFLACVNKNFDLRASIFPIAPEDRELIELGRQMGAAAKFPGSGGAVLFVCRSATHLAELETVLRSRNLSVLVPEIALPKPRLRAVFLAAGFGTRLYPLTLNTAKPLLEIGGKPMMTRIVDQVLALNPVDAVVVSNARFYSDFLDWKEAYRPQVALKVVNDGTSTNETRLGAIADLQLALNSMPARDDVDAIVVTACDNLFGHPLGGLVSRFAASGRGQLLVREIPEPVPPNKYSEVTLAENGQVVSFREKPADPRSNLSAIAFYILPPTLPDLIATYLSEGNNSDAPGYFIAWLSRRMQLDAERLRGVFVDIGSKEDLEKAGEAARLMDVRD